MTITVKDLLGFIKDNKVPDDAVIIVPKNNWSKVPFTYNGESDTVWCDSDDLKVDWDLNFHPDIDNKFFIGDI